MSGPGITGMETGTQNTWIHWILKYDNIKHGNITPD
jgi:hypothetical protein